MTKMPTAMPVMARIGLSQRVHAGVVGVLEVVLAVPVIMLTFHAMSLVPTRNYPPAGAVARGLGVPALVAALVGLAPSWPRHHRMPREAIPFSQWLTPGTERLTW